MGEYMIGLLFWNIICGLERARLHECLQLMQPEFFGVRVFLFFFSCPSLTEMYSTTRVRLSL